MALRHIGVFVCLLMVGCDPQPTQTSPEPDVIEDVTPETHEDVLPYDNGFLGHTQEYFAECIRSEYYFCPPLDEVWQKEFIVDICTGDILEVGECEQVFECDPSQYLLDTVACEEDGISGLQKVYCDKGKFITGPCVLCDVEICDGLDNDCDGLVDESLKSQDCVSDCGPGHTVCEQGVEICLGNTPPGEEICDYKDNDCDGETDEGSTNACGTCGPLVEQCNGADDDCDGETDEDLVETCDEGCGPGTRTCFGGGWSLCDPTPMDEVCDGLDNDCNGVIDDTLECACSQDDIGTLIPCQESPLLCGQGFKQCQCDNEDCTITKLTLCQPACAYPELGLGVSPEECVLKGQPVQEVCNNHDDDCDDLTDEDLVASCYQGPPGTADVGICQSGDQMCHQGQWGWVDQEGVFFPGMCHEQVLPALSDYCNGSDDNCDGIADEGEEIEPTDIVFIVDWSGSMLEEIDAVNMALLMYLLNFTETDDLRWAYIMAPAGAGATERLKMVTDLTPLDQFTQATSSTQDGPLGSLEPLVDALYLILGGDTSKLTWDMPASVGNGMAESEPPLDEFKLSWREDAKKLVFLFTDEGPQSFLWPANGGQGGISEWTVGIMVQADPDLEVYAFTRVEHKAQWSVVFGSYGYWRQLPSDAAEMFSKMIEIFDETLCH